MTEKEFIMALDSLKILYDAEKLKSLQIYCNYLLEYNEKVNLTAIKEKKDVYLKHFYDSLTLTKIIDLNTCQSLLDIGTGAGFPGIVIKIFYPQLNCVLVDSNHKKVAFLEGLIDKLNLKNIKIICDRVENIYADYMNSFDFVTSRAVANLKVLSELSLPFVKKGGYFIPMKGKIADEIIIAKKNIIKSHGNIEKILEFNLYKNEGKRSLIKIVKTKETKKNELKTYKEIINDR